MSVKIFFCYAREDEDLLDKLKAHLRPLQREGLIDVWHDREIRAGSDWEQEIKQHLDEAHIILLLISSDFMNSDYSYDVELQRALERQKKGEVKVIPVILRPVFWQVEALKRLQAVPTDGKPVTSRRDWQSDDDALYDVTQGLRKVIVDMKDIAVLQSAVAPPAAQKEVSLPFTAPSSVKAVSKPVVGEKSSPTLSNPMRLKGVSPTTPLSKPVSRQPVRVTQQRPILRKTFFQSKLALAATLSLILSGILVIFLKLSPGGTPPNPLTSPQTTKTASLIATARSTDATTHSTPTTQASATAVAQNLNATTVSRLKEQWAFPTGNVVDGLPVVANNVVYVGSADSSLYAIDAVSGQKKWAFPTQGQITSSPVVADNVVYVSSQDHDVYAIDAVSGQKKWAFSTGAEIDSSPVVADNVVYVDSGDGNLYAIDTLSGQERWEFPAEDGMMYSSPVVVNSVVYTASSDNSLCALNAVSGQREWSFPTGGKTYPFVVANSVMYAASSDKGLYALNAVSGQRDWSVSTGDRIDLAMVANNVLYAISNIGNVYAFGLPE